MIESPLPVDVPSQGSSPAGQRLTVVFALLAAGAAGLTALLALLPAAGHDQLWFLLMARRWLGGAILYGPGAFDSNPPAIVWLSAVPVALGRLGHVPATLPAKLLVALLGAACALLGFRFLPLSWRSVRRYEVAALLFAAVVLLGVVPARDLGQRDHLAGFLLLPYVLAAGVSLARAPLTWTRTAAGVLAGLAICLKPHYVLVPLVLETALLLRPRLQASPTEAGTREASLGQRARTLLRPEPLVILGVGVAYLLAISHFAPLYFTSALPITRAVYSAIGHLTFLQLVWQAVELSVLAVLALWLFARDRPGSPAVRMLLLAGVAGFAAYLLQGTGWYYQQLPALGFFGLALALELLGLLDLAAIPALRVPAWLPYAAAALTVLALALTTHFSGYPFTRNRAFSIESPDPALFSGLPPGTPVAILTTSVDEAMMPVERYGLVWAQRTDNLWLLPEILRAERPEGQPDRAVPNQAELQLLDMGQHRWTVEDLTRWQPQLVLIERCQDETVRCQVLEDRHDDLLAWFLRDRDFAALWRQHYTLAGTRGRFDVYHRH